MLNVTLTHNIYVSPHARWQIIVIAALYSKLSLRYTRNEDAHSHCLVVAIGVHDSLSLFLIIIIIIIIIQSLA